MKLVPGCTNYEELMNGFEHKVDYDAMVLVQWEYEGKCYAEIGWICEDPDCRIHFIHLVIRNKDEAVTPLENAFTGVNIVRIIPVPKLCEFLNANYLGQEDER